MTRTDCRTFAGFAAAALVIATLAGPDPAAAQSRTFEWSGQIGEGQALEVKGVNGAVEARGLNGSISTDFPLTVQGRFGPRSMDGTIGGGGPRLRLRTTNGSIEIRRAG